MKPSSNIPSHGSTASWLPRLGRRLGNLIVSLSVLVVILSLLCVGLIESNLVRGNYPTALKDLAWVLGEQEHVYNFDSVIPGEVFRSAQPDHRFINYVVKNYGIRHIITLNWRPPLDTQTAGELGVTYTTFDWDEDNLPTREEFQQVVSLLDDKAPVLVHCTAGKDRTGYLIAAYRILEMNWPTETALNEMHHYGHKPERYTEALAYFMKMVAPKSPETVDASLYQSLPVVTKQFPEPSSRESLSKPALAIASNSALNERNP